ncbi:hypothetical protein K493DRAFT_41596 [Basidiobolus meristosporus CBS 931.73]|uniref:Uncharacterized protein n=1 Tax=Basidiobolus meristosporus CBS 931.73 TaxID=1314790 RepID=A0A1Y1Y3T2_9FUNG|nr:hypothetical protein K493DRAFT_41596 [Basidiobolus meristosporus CBS 931.73]|eukprot:ORX92691.1 hypothetical protein K493DRAFT_41596 [Basidiobolus meristosporus CBS 931.73]
MTRTTLSYSFIFLRVCCFECGFRLHSAYSSIDSFPTSKFGHLYVEHILYALLHTLPFQILFDMSKWVAGPQR